MRKYTTLTGLKIVSEAKRMLDKWQKEGCKEKESNVIYCSVTKSYLKFPFIKVGQSWCAAFVSNIVQLVSANLSYVTKVFLTGSTRQMKLNSKVKIDQIPTIGSIFYRYQKSDKNYGHVGIVVDLDENYVYAIEGNSSDEVRLNKYTYDYVKSGSNKMSEFYFIHSELEGNDIKEVEVLTKAGELYAVDKVNNENYSGIYYRNFFAV
jgi:hypothetical protein